MRPQDVGEEAPEPDGRRRVQVEAEVAAPGPTVEGGELVLDEGVAQGVEPVGEQRAIGPAGVDTGGGAAEEVERLERARAVAVAALRQVGDEAVVLHIDGVVFAARRAEAGEIPQVAQVGDLAPPRSAWDAGARLAGERVERRVAGGPVRRVAVEAGVLEGRRARGLEGRAGLEREGAEVEVASVAQAVDAAPVGVAATVVLPVDHQRDDELRGVAERLGDLHRVADGSRVGGLRRGGVGSGRVPAAAAGDAPQQEQTRGRAPAGPRGIDEGRAVAGVVSLLVGAGVDRVPEEARPARHVDQPGGPMSRGDREARAHPRGLVPRGGVDVVPRPAGAEDQVAIAAVGRGAREDPAVGLAVALDQRADLYAFRRPAALDLTGRVVEGPVGAGIDGGDAVVAERRDRRLEVRAERDLGASGQEVGVGGEPLADRLPVVPAFRGGAVGEGGVGEGAVGKSGVGGDHDIGGGGIHTGVVGGQAIHDREVGSHRVRVRGGVDASATVAADGEEHAGEGSTHPCGCRAS